MKTFSSIFLLLKLISFLRPIFSAITIFWQITVFHLFSMCQQILLSAFRPPTMQSRRKRRRKQECVKTFIKQKSVLKEKVLEDKRPSNGWLTYSIFEQQITRSMAAHFTQTCRNTNCIALKHLLDSKLCIGFEIL